MQFPMFRSFISGLPATLAGSFAGWKALAHPAMAGITYIVVVNGTDWVYFLETRGPFVQSLTIPAGIIGFFVPILMPVAMYMVAYIRSSVRLRVRAILLAHAAIAAWLISSTYKAFTGRVQPEFFTFTSTIDNSRDFNFGFWEHGIFWGWPSSHTAVAFAMSVALMYAFPKSIAVRILAPLYALYIGLGASIGFHWLSDALAGALLGVAVGVAAARAWKSRLL